MQKGAIYARYSTDRQNPKSIEDQIAICRDYATRSGIEIVATYTDEETSGYNPKREGLLKLLEDARAKEFDVVLTEHTSRLARDGLELRRLLNEFRYSLRIPVIFVSQNLRTDRDQDLAIIKLFNIVDEQYVEAVKIATRRGLEGLFKRGKWTGGGVPYGYTVKNGMLTVDQKEAEIVRLIFREYDSGTGLKNIAKLLNGRGIKTKKGNFWSAASLSNLIKNPIYKGTVVWGKHRYVLDPFTGKRKKVEGDPITREDPSLAIVDPELWRRCNDKISKVRAGKPKSKKLHPLSGLIKCGHCGFHFVKEGNYLYCSGYRNRKSCDNYLSLKYDFLLRWLVGQLKKFILLHKEEILAIIKDLKSGQNTKEIEDSIKAHERKLKNLLDLYAENPSTAVKEKIKETEEAIEELKAKLKATANVSFDLDKALGLLESVVKANPEEANLILKEFVGEITIYNNEGIIDLRVKGSRHLTEVFGIRSIAGAGFEPATSGL